MRLRPRPKSGRPDEGTSYRGWLKSKSLGGFALGFALASFSFLAVGKLAPPAATAEPRVQEEGGSVVNAPAEIGPECYVGVVLASEAVDVVAEIEGRLETALIRPGDRVEPSQALATLDSESLRHQQKIERARLVVAETEVRRDAAEVEQADRKYQRRQALGDLVSPEETESGKVQLDAASYRLEVSKAVVGEVLAQLDQIESGLERSVLRAPFTGVVALRYLDPGARVTPGTPVARLIGVEATRVRFAIPPAATGFIHPGTAVRIEIEALGRTSVAVVEHLSPEIDAVSDKVFVEARMRSTPIDASYDAPEVPAGAVARVSAVLEGQPQSSCLDP